jgi:putative FmdB family regulatory protein
MPTYAYRCNDCNADFKAFHGVDDKQDGCVKCSSISIQRVFLPIRTVAVAQSESSAQRVEKFIEESREALQEQMAEARKEIK